MNDLSKPDSRSMYRFLMLLTIGSTLGLQAWRTLFDNFSVKVVGLDGGHIGVIQSVREIPGFLALLVIFIMLLIKEHRISSLSILTLGVGVGITGLFPSYFGLIGTTVVMSLGFHYYETTFQSLTLQYFDKKTSPLVFGRLRSVAAASNIAVGALIFLLTAYLTFTQMYLFIGGLILLIGIWSYSRNPADPDIVSQRKRMILRKHYWLYYFLTFMAGARRQIFVAFAVFLLVKKFEFSVQEITALFVINNVINYFLAPFIGKAIVRFGERKVLSTEYFSLIFVFVAYAAVDSKIIVAVLYIIDHVLFNFAMAIRTFFQKIGDPRDIAPSMAVGFTINHIGAVIFPVIGGILWMIDYRIPFIAGAIFSLISLLAVQLITGQVKRAADI
ncbi:MAG: MFS transporter [candidate division Zixibacteria bacterium]|nr:MFS transporter [candidate division Zixibacteria bacterium]